jgi:outer membrane protein OmpA-like peptidoglycan-associated protein
MVAPLVMSVLGKQILQNGLSASGLGSLLAGQRGWLSKLLPSGVSEIPGLNALADYSDQAGAAVRGAAQYGEKAIRGTSRDAYQAATGLVQPARPWLSALLPLLLIALALGALPMMMRGCGTNPISVARAPEVRVPEVRVSQVAVPETKDAVVRVAGYGPDLGKLADVKLPDGVNVAIPEASYLHGVYRFLSEAGSGNSRTFVFEDVSFDGPSIKTVPATETAVKIVSRLLKAFPGVNIRIDGHTDNTGDPVANRRLSLERANAVKDVLVKAGVPADRISTEGFGSEKPLAPNDTEENRAKNRRIELTLQRGKA